MYRRPLPVDYLDTALALYRLRRAGRIPRLWIDCSMVRVEAAPDVIRPLSWSQAARLVGGEPLESVVRLTRGPLRRTVTP